MKGFDLHEPTTVPQAVGLLDQLGPGGKVLAGGSDIVGGILKDWVSGKGMPLPSALVDITTIPDLKGITPGSNGLTIGATTTLAEVIESADVQKSIPLLSEAAKTIASPLIRNFGTLGGNINQRPRCWFFRGEDFNCYKKGGDFCYSVTGDNTYHAIIGGELCYIVHPSDTSTALLALNASARVVGPSGERMVAFDSYFHGPREDVLTENVLKPNELLTEVLIPTPAAGTKMAWTKLKDRQVYDFGWCRWPSRSAWTAPGSGRTAGSCSVAWRRCRIGPPSSRRRSRARTSKPPPKPPPRRSAPSRDRCR